MICTGSRWCPAARWGPPYTPDTPVEVLVDGMNFKFSDGTLFTDDVFTVTTGDTGIPLSKNTEGYPTAETLSDWHWTLDSFAGQFNRVGPVQPGGTGHESLHHPGQPVAIRGIP